jgi:hypothetical protein
LSHHTSNEQARRYFRGRPHTAIPEAPLECAAAWRGAEIRAAGEFRYRLDDAEIAELESALAHAISTGKATIDLEADDFPLARLAPRIAEWRRELGPGGRGFVVISGVPVERWRQADAERFFWAFGQHLGTPGTQNPQGDLLGHVTDTGDAAKDPLVRLYRTAANINYHCDGADVVGLLCLRAAPHGGASRIASSVTVFNELLVRDPALAQRLFEPVRMDRRNEQAPGEKPYLYMQPACFDGEHLRTFYHSDYYRSVTRHVGPLPEEEQALLDAYEAIAEDEEIRLEMQLEPGDIQLLSNHTIMHARTAYEDGTAKRHLLRLWLTL